MISEDETRFGRFEIRFYLGLGSSRFSIFTFVPSLTLSTQTRTPNHHQIIKYWNSIHVLTYDVLAAMVLHIVAEWAPKILVSSTRSAVPWRNGLKAS